MQPMGACPSSVWPWQPFPGPAKLLTSLWTPGMILASVLSWREGTKRQVGAGFKITAYSCIGYELHKSMWPYLGSERTQLSPGGGRGSEENTALVLRDDTILSWVSGGHGCHHLGGGTV